MADPIPPTAFTTALSDLLVETFESPPRPGSAYLDQGAGLFDTLADVSAERASRPAFPGATTIAQQVAHVRFYFEVLQRYLSGTLEGKADWDGSWRTVEVDAAAWDDLRDGLREDYRAVREGLERTPSWGEREMGGAMAVLAHTAYHLGALRQLIKAGSSSS